MEKKNIDWGNLGFGYVKTDYRYVSNYKNGAWDEGGLTTDDTVTISECAGVLQYAQTVFEGLKAYRTKEGKLLLFRPEMNAKRFANSNRRLCMEVLPEELFVDAIATLVSYEKDWIPTAEGTSLYIRPFMFATERAVGVHPSNAYKFMIILSPVGAYYPEGVNPVKIYVEDEYVRATKGGTGFAKCGGNYAASIAAQVKAEKLGYTQVLWLDGVERKYVEEGGSLCMIGGYMSFTGIDGTARYGQTEIADVLPVEMLDIDDRVEAPQGLVPELIEEHEAVSGLEGEWPYLLGYNKTITKSDAKTLVKIGEDPLIAIGEYGKGKSAVFTSDCSPHWGSPAFVEWEKYDLLWKDLLDWMTK